MPDEVLSQEEVESLLRALDPDTTPAPKVEGRQRRPAPPGRGRDKITPYDFKRPERVGKDQMRALQSLHESFGRNFGAALSAMLRTIIEVKLSRVDQMTYSEFALSLENPTCFNLLRAEPLEGHLILDINPAVLFPIIDRLLGGGKQIGPPARRPLTEIELRLVSRLTGLFLVELRRAWENVVELDLGVERVESNPQLIQVVPPNEVVVALSFEVAFGDVRGLMNLCIPFNTIERYSGKLTSNGWGSYSRGTTSEETVGKLSHAMSGSRVELVATLARSTLTTADLLSLRVGDIITTDHDTKIPLSVEVQGVAKFFAHPGAFKGHKALQIEQVADRQ